MKIDKAALEKECTFTTAKSGGPGGQHVNKVETKVILKFNIDNSLILNEREKSLIKLKLKQYINKDNTTLLIYNQETSSQVLNKQRVLNYLLLLFKKAFFIPKKRKKTKPSKSSQEKRLKEKRIRSETKSNRKKDF